MWTVRLRARALLGPRGPREREGGFARLTVPSRPRPKPSSRRRGARPAWPHPCQSPRGPAHPRSAPFRVPFAVALCLALCTRPALFFRTRPVTLCQRMSALPVVVKCLWTLKFLVLFLTQRLRSSGPSGLYCSNYQALL